VTWQCNLLILAILTILFSDKMSGTEELNHICANTLISHLGIEFTDSGEGFVKAKMPVDHRTFQPAGILHGGASFSLAETVGSAGSFLMVDKEKYTVVGMQMSGNHVSRVSHGWVYAHATLVHKGSVTHVWDITISGENGQAVSLCRQTNMIIEKGL
jgi:1,4-dihydroxy-2-naphthoyl-CoA hydrolase